jgi:Domain of unknown function (DUF1929)
LLALSALLSMRSVAQPPTQLPSPVGQWLPPYQHSGTLPAGVPAGEFWPSSFQAINLAVIPYEQGVAANDVVIAWDAQYRDPTSVLPAAGWYQRYTVGNPELPASFKNRFVRIPRGPATAAEPNGMFLGDLFCSSQCWLPDGRLFIAGGNAQYALIGLQADAYVPAAGPFAPNSFTGSRYVGIWDPANADNPGANFGWTHIAEGPQGKPMAVARWYPTVAVVSDRHVMVAGGQVNTSLDWSVGQDAAYDTYELFNFLTGDWERDASQVQKVFDGPRGQQPPSQRYSYLGSYPRVHLLTNNRTFLAGMWEWTSSIDMDPNLPTTGGWNSPQSGAWSPPIQSTNQLGTSRIYGCSVVVPNLGNVSTLRDEVMIIGGGIFDTTVHGDSRRILAATATSWGATSQPLHGPRMVANAVLAPTGDIVLIGGSREYYFPSPNPQPELRTEVWSRTTGWVTDAVQVAKRMYHSTAALLPSGNFVSGGSDDWQRTVIGPGGALADWDIYVPRYLRQGHARPQFAGSWSGSLPVQLQWAAHYTIPYAGLPENDAVARVVLMRPCSTNHHFDSDQRYVELEIETEGDAAPGLVEVVMPPAPLWNGTTQGSVTTPPGYYMAFLVSTTGSVSTARWVKFL